MKQLIRPVSTAAASLLPALTALIHLTSPWCDSFFVQLNGGNDTLNFSGTSAQSTVYGGAGDDSITAGGSQLTVKGQKGNDTLDLTASSASTFDAGAGTNYLRATSVGTSTTSIFGGDSADTLEVVSGTLRSYMKGGNDSLTVTTVAGGTIYGGSSLQDTAGGNDTLNVAAITAGTMIDMAGGTNFVTASSGLVSASIYGGTGNDTR